MKKYIYILCLIFLGIHTQAQVHRAQKKGWVVYVNKLPNVNSNNAETEEISPIISKDGNHLFFVRMRDAQNIAYDEYPNNQDIWYSKKENNKWSTPVNIGDPVNNKYHNVICGTNANGTIIYLSNEYHFNRKGKLKAMSPGMSYSEKKADGTWSRPKNIKLEGLKKSHIDQLSHFYFHRSDDGKVILFSAKVKDPNIAKQDEEEKIFACFQKGKNTYGDIVRLSDKVNAAGTSETAPFFSEDGMKLFFTSLSRDSKAELYVVDRKISASEVNSSKKENWESPSAWGEPKPIYAQYNYSESPLHHSGFEGYFFLHQENKREIDVDDYGVFAMSNPGKAADIYEINFRRFLNVRLKTYEEISENGNTRLEPVLLPTYLTNNGKKISPVDVNQNTSTFSFYRKPDTASFNVENDYKSVMLDTKRQAYDFKVGYNVPDNYELIAEKSSQKLAIDEKSFNGTNEDEVIIKLVFKKKGSTPNKPVTIKNGFMVTLNFDWDSFFIRPMEREILNELSAVLRKSKTAKLMIYGHTDNTGSPELKNNQLSKNRIASTLQYLKYRGVKNEADIAAFSEFMLKVKPTGEEAEERNEKNRRTEVLILNADIEKDLIETLCRKIKQIRTRYSKEFLNDDIDCFRIVQYDENQKVK